MPESKHTICNELGLHARAAAAFVKLASRFKSEITIYNGEQMANGKSILGLLTLAASCGTDIRLIAEGEDAQEALDALGGLIDNKFNE